MQSSTIQVFPHQVIVPGFNLEGAERRVRPTKPSSSPKLPKELPRVVNGKKFKLSSGMVGDKRIGFHKKKGVTKVNRLPKKQPTNKPKLLECETVELSSLDEDSESDSEIRPILEYPPEGKITISTEDYKCLGTDEFLNDVIIDFYLKYLHANLLSKEQREKVHIFSTFFYTRLTKNPRKASGKSQPAELDPNLSAAEKRHCRVKTWTKDVNIFEKDFIIVPINQKSHWFLAIICFPNMNGSHTMDGKPIKIDPKQRHKKMSTRPPIKQPCILIFDSLAEKSRSRVVATLRDYLSCEYKAKHGVEKIYTKDVIKEACPKVPQQKNFTDCGLYILQYVEQFFNDPIKDYNIPISNLETWFDEMTVTKKREEISLKIKELMTQTGKDLNILPDVIFPTLNGELTVRRPGRRRRF